MKELPFEIRLTIIIAIIMMLTIVVFLVFLIVMYYRKQVLFQKEKQLKEIEHRNQILQTEVEYQKKALCERERISHDMHDDFGAAISAIKLQIEFLKRKVKDKNLEEHINDLLKTCEEMNISMREMLWNLKAENEQLANFVDHIIYYAESFFAKTDITVMICKQNFSDQQVSAETRRNIFLSMKEALNNIYKHSNAQNVELIFAQHDDEFSIEIKDDGIGLPENVKLGNGFSNMKARMQSSNGTFEIVPSESGMHTKFLMTI